MLALIVRGVIGIYWNASMVCEDDEANAGPYLSIRSGGKSGRTLGEGGGRILEMREF